MTVTLDFTEEQLCELWMQHTSLEDDPRDANNDLQVAFEDDDGLRQELTVAPDLAEDDQHDIKASAATRARFARVRPTGESEWSRWSRLA